MDWRKHERHQLSERYPDIKGQAWDDFLDNLSKRKIRGRTITLYENKILDGWQLYRACLQMDIEPKFVVLREGEDPLAFVEEANDHRRHESQEVQARRAAQRRERVADARRKGQSLRVIAETEGVGESTVRRDLETSGAPGGAPDTNSSGVHPRTPEPGTGGPPGPPEPPDGKVTGKDGKEYPAAKPKLLCEGCSTRLRKGQPVKEKCQECKVVRAAARDEKKGGTNQDADPVPESPPAPPMDDLGNQLPKKLRDAFAGNRKTIGDVVKILFEARRMLKGLGNWNPFIREHGTAELITKAVDDMKNGIPYAVCACEGKGCETCRKSGWLPKWKHAEVSCSKS